MDDAGLRPWSRRDVLHLGAASAAGAGVTPAGPSDPAPADATPRLRTPVCTLLGIEHPLLQAPMGGVVTPAMVAAVGEAGGLGVLAGVMLPPDELRRQIREVRALTSRPFGVNLLLQADFLHPVDPVSLPAPRLAAARSSLDRVRAAMGLPARDVVPPAVPAGLVAAGFEVILEERVPLFSVGLGHPTPEMVARCHERGMKVMAMASTFPDAKALANLGVDLLVIQGAEAGGHRSTSVKRAAEEASIGTLVLVRQAARALRIPVVAAGGIVDGQGLVAALALGAAGVLMGTRFIATRESAAAEFWKRALVEADSDDTTLSEGYTGMWARFLRNEFTRVFARADAAVFPPGAQLLAARDIIEAAARGQDGRYYPMYAGQGTGLIEDIPGAADVVRRVVREAQATLGSLASLGR